MTRKPWSTKSKSPYIGLREGSARPFYEPSQMYEFLFDNTDRHGVLLYSIRDLARAAMIGRTGLQFFIIDMKKLGYIEDHGHKGSRLLYKPSEIEWTDELYAELKVFRKERSDKVRKPKGDT